MKDGCPCRYEYTILQGATNKVSIWPDQTVIADLGWVVVCTANDGVLHNNTILPDLKRLVLSDNASTEHNAAAWADSYIATDSRVWSYVSRRIDMRCFIKMSK